MAGAGYKLFNTGDVLTAAQVNTYLQEQVVMVFNDAAARTTALSGVLAEGMVSYLKSTKVVEIYNGTAWASLDDPNAIQNTIVDAKGDLIAATGNDVPARLAVGNNGETLIADSSTSTGLRYTAGNPIGNPVLNSAYDVWQRGTSIAVTSNLAGTYTADRWAAVRSSAATGATISRQATGDTTNLPIIQYCARVQRDSGNTSTASINIANIFESVNSIPFAGRTVTLSFYARAGALFSAASSVLTAELITGTGTDQNVFGGFTNGAATISLNSTISTTWVRYTATATIPAATTQIAINFKYTPVGTAGATDYFEVTGVQIDVGSVALPYRRAMNTLAGELQAAQRYYYRVTGSSSSALLGTLGFAKSTTVAVMPFALPVTMRTSVSSIETGGTPQISDGTTGYSSGTWALDSSWSNGACITYTHGSAALTAFRPYFPQATTSTSYFGFNAEL